MSPATAACGKPPAKLYLILPRISGICRPTGSIIIVAGAGVGLCRWAQYKPKRIAAGRVKAEQIRASGAKLVVAPCHNCFDQINDLSEAYMLDVKALSLKEIICEIMIVPDNFRPVQQANDQRAPEA